jgi:hypothetical protein
MILGPPVVGKKKAIQMLRLDIQGQGLLFVCE